MNILLVEDDGELARQVQARLEAAGHAVHAEAHGTTALGVAMSGCEWELAILDVSLPGFNGFEILERMRAAGVDKPVIFLTAKGDVADRVRGLSLGADDYLTKPFSMDELLARLQALSRRLVRGSSHAGLASPPLPEGWVLNPILRQLTVRGETIPLQPREWSLLELFLQHEGEILTKSFLLDRVWDVRFDPGTNVVDAMVCRLRKKLDPGEGPSHVETVRGRGFIFHCHAGHLPET